MKTLVPSRDFREAMQLTSRGAYRRTFPGLRVQGALPTTTLVLIGLSAKHRLAIIPTSRLKKKVFRVSERTK